MNFFSLATTRYKGNQRYNNVIISLSLVVYKEKGKAQINDTYEKKSFEQLLNLLDILSRKS